MKGAKYDSHRHEPTCCYDLQASEKLLREDGIQGFARLRQAWSVWSIWLIWFVLFIWLIWLVLVHQTNETD
jgi:hypothetical protein